MMSQNRFFRSLFLLFIIVFSFQNFLHAQNFSNGMMQGKIRVKIKPSYLSSLDIKKPAWSKSISTGVSSLDKLNSAFAVTSMKRVFPYSEAFEERHQKYGLDRWYEISIGTKAATSTVVADYKGNEAIELAEPIYEIKLVDGSSNPTYLNPTMNSRGTELPYNDPLLLKQWNYNNTGQSGGTEGADINLFKAWQKVTGNPRVIVSIHDMGVQTDHDDLMNMMWVNLAEKNGVVGKDDDGNGYIDDINGFNFTNNTGDIQQGYHGTHVAGTIAAQNNNGIGVAGVAGGSGNGDGVRMMSCQILGGNHAADVAASYVYAADNGAVISQNSWGYTAPDYFEQATKDGIDYFIAEAGNYIGSPMKGGVVIFAAGNTGTDNQWFPGAYEPIICVAALNATSIVTPYSNYGSWVDISAPGGFTDDDVTIGSGNSYSNGILSTLDHNSYGYLDGTSMACPHVSGVAALIVSKFGSNYYTGSDLKNQLLTGVRDIYDIEGNKDFQGKLGTGIADAELGIATNNKTGPLKISDLALTGISQDFATLKFTIPSDPDDGIPTKYELYWSTDPITPANIGFARMQSALNKKEAGSTFQYEIKSLKATTRYYFAVRSLDRWGNYSPLSNIVESSTNAGPRAELDPLKTMLSINLNISTADKGADSILLSNKGEGILRWEAAPRHISAEPLSTRPALRYPLVQATQPKAMGIISSKFPSGNIAPASIQKDTFIGKGYVDSWSDLMVFGETNTKLTNSSATRFHVDESDGFNLTGVETYLQHEESTGPVILEIYKGSDISVAQLMLAQEVPITNQGSYTFITLDEQIFFEKDSWFWVVIHVPAGNKFPLGGGLELQRDDSKNCYMSLNGGKSWRLFEELYYDNQVVWALFAISQQKSLDAYIRIEPSSGEIPSGGSARIKAKVDGSMMINGQYKGKLVVYTNETGATMQRVPVVVNVQGHKPVIAPIKRIDYGGVLLGNSKQLHIDVKNIGLGRFKFKSTSVVLSNPFFELWNPPYGTLESGDEAGLVITFKPATQGNHICRVTLQEEGGNNYSFELFGTGIEPPVAAINPASKSLNNLRLGDSITGEFYLLNKGKYSLDYYLPNFANGSNMESIPSDIHKFGYTTRVDSIGTNYVWNDIALTGTDITAGFSGNTMTNIYQKVSLDFLFPFFGKNENFVYISKYGVVSFTDSGSIWAQSPLAYNFDYAPSRYISGCGFPMLFMEAGFGKVFYKRESDRFVVQYDDAPYYWGLYWNEDYTKTFRGSITFQIILHDNGNISMFYKTGTLPRNVTRDALIAIADRNRNDGVFVTGNRMRPWYNKWGFSFKAGTSVQFINPGLGLFTNISNTFGSVLPNDSSLIRYNINTSNLAQLAYTENLVVVTNDPVNNPVIHSLEFNITQGGVPVLSADTNKLDFGTVFMGAPIQKNLMVSNSGTATSQIQSVSFDHGYFTLTASFPEILKPDRRVPYAVKILSSTPGTYSDTLRIHATGHPDLKIALSGTVIPGPTLNVLNSSDNPFTSVTKINVPAGTAASAVTMKIKNSGAHPLEVAAGNTDWINVSGKTADGILRNSYTWKSSKETGGPRYEWVDAMRNGIKITEELNPWIGKEWSSGIPLPFPFQYYGKEYDTIFLGYSGLVTFTGGQDDYNYFWGGGEIPDMSIPNNFIAPLFLFGGPDSKMYYPNTGIYYLWEEDRAIIEFHEFNSNFYMGPPISFQLLLYKNGNIKMQYKMPEDGNNTVTPQGVIGIENEDGSSGIMIANRQYFVDTDMAIGIYPAPFYQVDPNTTKEFNILLTAVDLVAGSYSDSLRIWSNDPLIPLKKIPAKLVVTGTAQVNIPDSLHFGDILLNPEAPVREIEFEFANPGSANYSITQCQQTLPEAFKLEAFMQMSVLRGWVPIQNDVFPRTIQARTTLRMKVTLQADAPLLLHDTLRLTTDAGNFNIPMGANVYLSPGVAILSKNHLPADTLSVYALSDQYFRTDTLTLVNTNNDAIKGYPLNYKLSIDYLRDVETESFARVLSTTSAGATGSVYSKCVQAELKPDTGKIAPQSFSGEMEAFNRTLKYDTATVSQTALGYGGSLSFYSATAFNAPADGFNLTHVQTWYVPGDWLNSKIRVKIYGGNDDLSEAALLHSQTFDYSTPKNDYMGSLLTFQLSKELSFYPNERFFVVFGYDAAAGNPQGSVLVPGKTDGRFLFGPGDLWYDITGQGSLSEYGWMVRACEEHAKNTVWVALASADTGSLKSSAEQLVSLNFAAELANQGDNYAHLVVHSNSVDNPEKRFVLHLRKNKGPEFNAAEMKYTVSENDTLHIAVISQDLDGDEFSLALDSLYPFLQLAQPVPEQKNASGKGILPVTKTINLLYTPDYNSQGLHYFYIKGEDANGNINKGRLQIEVANVNRAPQARSMDTLVLDGNGNYYLLKPSFLFYDPDVSDKLMMDATLEQSGVVDLFASGSNYMLAPVGNGTARLSFYVRDPFGATAINKLIVTTRNIVAGSPISDADQFTVYPNPAREYLKIHLPDGAEGPVAIQIFNQMGQVVMTRRMEQTAAREIFLDIRTLSDGIYLLRVQSTHSEFSGKLLKCQ